MIAALLRGLTSNGFRRGMAGSRVWIVIAIGAWGVRLIRRMAATNDEVLYRTVVHAGDVFEVVSRAATK